MDACACINFNALSLSVSSRSAVGLTFLASPIALLPLPNSPFSPVFGSLAFALLNSPSAEDDDEAPPDLGDTDLEDNALLLAPVLAQASDLIPDDDFCPIRADLALAPLEDMLPGDFEEDCGFFEAGPEFTPGFSPVWILGDPLPLELDEELLRLPDELPPPLPIDEPEDEALGLDDSFVRVLHSDILIPSELCFTMYSEFFTSVPGFLLAFLPSAPTLLEEPLAPRSFCPWEPPPPLLLDFWLPLEPPSSVQCCAFFSLSTIALSDPLRFLCICCCCDAQADEDFAVSGPPGGGVLAPLFDMEDCVSLLPKSSFNLLLLPVDFTFCGL